MRLLRGRKVSSPGRAMALGAATTVAYMLPVFLLAALAVQVSTELALEPVGLGAAVGVFFGSMALTSVHLGRVVDWLGAIVSMRISALGSATAALGIAATARSWSSLGAWLALAGLAAALGQPAANRVLSRRVRPERLGTAFGLKQAAPPIASMLAGLSVPFVAVHLGWRAAFLIAGLGAVLVAVAVGRRPSSASGRGLSPRTVLPPLRDRPTLLLLALGLGLAFAANSTVLAFYVVTAVEAGTSENTAALVFSGASLAAILVRILAGVACDLFRPVPLQLSAALLGTGALGIILLAIGRPSAVSVGAVIAISGTWGFNSAFWFALVRAYADAPGRATGTAAPAALGGLVGPIGFGPLATYVGYPAAWAATAGLAVLAAIAMLVAAARLRSADPVG
jgi:predicted MFS family arabinose efflux permease